MYFGVRGATLPGAVWMLHLLHVYICRSAKYSYMHIILHCALHCYFLTMWQTNISFCSSCSEECHITDPPLVSRMQAYMGLYRELGLIAWIGPKWSRWDRRRKEASWKWSPSNCHHPGYYIFTRDPKFLLHLPLSYWEGFLQLLYRSMPCYDMPTAMLLYLRFLPQMCYVQSPAWLFSHFTLGPTGICTSILLAIDSGYTNSCQQLSNKNIVFHKMPTKK